ncbi:MAG: EamA family transporter [Treponema sp.]|jgi:drug/metabolite transporter (DMT)-like permease|nr:EamA family transporter [Treponema sp.]
MLSCLVILVMTLAASLASFFLKKSSGGGTVASIIRSGYFYAGGFLYVISALLNIWILKRLPYSVVVPLGGACYIWTMLIAGKFLGEKIGPGKIIGVALIISGVVCVAV